MKEIRFGSMLYKHDILGLETTPGEEQEFGGTLLVKIQLLREEEENLQEVMSNCA